MKTQQQMLDYFKNCVDWKSALTILDYYEPGGGEYNFRNARLLEEAVTEFMPGASRVGHIKDGVDIEINDEHGLTSIELKNSYGGFKKTKNLVDFIFKNKFNYHDSYDEKTMDYLLYVDRKYKNIYLFDWETCLKNGKMDGKLVKCRIKIKEDNIIETNVIPFEAGNVKENKEIRTILENSMVNDGESVDTIVSMCDILTTGERKELITKLLGNI